SVIVFVFFQAEDGIRDFHVTGVQTCALPISSSSFKLLFHDTHHRSVTDERWSAELELDGYHGVLAFGEAVRERYLSRGWSRRARSEERRVGKGRGRRTEPYHLQHSDRADGHA